MRIAALDLGSNSFHLLVVEALIDGTFESLVREKVMLRLGDDVGRDGLISADKCDEAVAAVRHLVALARSAGADEIVSKATAALREALNGSELVDRMEGECGIAIDVISGVEEARLVFSAVRACVALQPAPALCLDLGGGSLELMVGDQATLNWSASLRLGVGRLTAELVQSDPPSDADLKSLKKRVQELLGPHEATIKGLAPATLVGSSGTLTTLAKVALSRRKGNQPPSVNQLQVDDEEINAICHDLLEMPSSERARLDGLDAKRADTIPAGVIVLSEVMKSFNLKQLTISEWALREGIVLEAIRRHDPAEWANEPLVLRKSSVESLARRCRYQKDHADKVVQLSLSLFDQLKPLHDMSATERELLEYAAMLHDIGEHVAMDDHDQHSAYLIFHGKLRGFSPHEITALACMARFHRRGSPSKANFEPFGSLDSSQRKTVLMSTAILRVADALDRSHDGVVQGVEVDIDDSKVRLLLDAPRGADVEIWGLRRKGNLLQDTFSCTLEASERSD